jgi:hypothetical protein
MPFFQFTVNDSFLHDVGHPITVPKGQLPYPEFLSAGIDHDKVTVILPQGERFEAEVYHGDAGFGEYYQIRFTGNDRTLPSYIKLHDYWLVVPMKMHSHSYVIIEKRL